MANYQNNFVNLTYKKDIKMYEANLSKETCPLFSDGDKVYVSIKERETNSGKKIKGSLIVNPTGAYNNYGEPEGQFVWTLWENINETTNKVSWNCTYEKWICWISMYQQQSNDGNPKYCIRVSWDADAFDEQDVSKDEKFWTDTAPVAPAKTPDLPF